MGSGWASSCLKYDKAFRPAKASNTKGLWVPSNGLHLHILGYVIVSILYKGWIHATEWGFSDFYGESDECFT